MPLDGKHAIVTGAARGIGAAIAARLAREGAHVLAVDRLPSPAGTDLQDGRIEPFEADMSDPDTPARIAAHLGERTLDILVNNAGIGASRPLWETTDADWDRYLNINLSAVFRMCRDLLPHFAVPGASIVNISSIFGLVGYPGSLPYSVSKAGLAQLTRQLAADLGPRGMRVNAIAPGVIETELTRDRIHNDAWYRKIMCDAIALRRNGTPDDIAGVAAFLCSDDASYMTAQVLVVDGGWLDARFLERPDA
jgi:3-oxoacyl-[acyl-carrier protein] reductase